MAGRTLRTAGSFPEDQWILPSHSSESFQREVVLPPPPPLRTHSSSVFFLSQESVLFTAGLSPKAGAHVNDLFSFFFLKGNSKMEGLQTRR